MKKIKSYFLFVAFIIVALNVIIASNESSSSDFQFFNLAKLNTAFAEGVEGDGIKNVVKVDCKCSNRDNGFTLKCQDVKTEGEVCSTDPLKQCYKINILGKIMMCD